MEIGDRLALDDLAWAHHVVAGRQMRDDDVDPERTKQLWDARAPFSDVSGYRHANVPTPSIIPSEQRLDRAAFVPTLRGDCPWQFSAEGRELP